MSKGYLLSKISQRVTKKVFKSFLIHELETKIFFFIKLHLKQTKEILLVFSFSNLKTFFS